MTVPRETNLHVIDGAGPGASGGGDLHSGLQRVCAEIDAEIAGSGATRRVVVAVLSEAGAAPHRRLRWVAIAATLVLAAGLGGFVEMARQQPAGDVNVVALDPLTFGAVAVDQ
jgi:hypothetical protein